MAIRTSTQTRRLLGACAAAVLAGAWHIGAGAQGSAVTIIFPTRIAAGPDFATDVLRDPWDMSNIEDISPDPGERAGFASFAVANGLAGGTTSSVDAGVTFLSRSVNGVINMVGRNGVQFPIDTARFQKLSVMLSDTGTFGENPQIYWYPNTAGDPAAPAPEFGIKFLPRMPQRPGNAILVKDLTGTPDDPKSVPWTSRPVMRGLRIDPNSNTSGNSMFFDWVRLTCADNSGCATMNTVQWNGGSGNATVDVTDAARGTTLTLGTNIAATQLIWNTGVLPPGSYTLRVTRGTGTPATKTFTINNPPSIKVLDPSRTTGPDFATTVLGNPWDMSDPADVPKSSNLTAVSFNGQFNATNTNGDPAIELLNNTNNAGGARAIDTSRYRYLTYRMATDCPFNGGLGSISRVFWGSSDFNGGNEMTVSRDIFLFDGMQSYTLDLASLSLGVLGGLEQPAAPTALNTELWTTNNKRQLRFDPHEFAAACPFHVDDVKLTANPETSGAYTIRWSGADADPADAPTVSLSYDTDRNPGGTTLIKAGLPLSQGSYLWDASALPSGTYYIYALVDDSLNQSGAYSDAPIFRTCVGIPTGAPAPYSGGPGTVAVTASAPGCAWNAVSNSPFVTITAGGSGSGSGTVSYTVARNPGRTARTATITIAGQAFTITQPGIAIPGDFDGNGRADYAVFHPGSGVWSAPGQTNQQWGLPGDIPVPGDYNGDGVLDRAVYRPATGDWFIQGQPTIQWGRGGDVPVPADYDGDGKTDPAVFRTTDGTGGTWYVRGQPARAFGLRGDVPVPADYDGDGLADLAVFRPASGTWFIALSTTGYATVTTIQWGLAGDVPVPGDFDGDHRADPAVYRPSTGTWYLLFSAVGYTTSFTLQWGILGDVPIAADFTGDGIDDPTVFRASDATFWTYDPVLQNGSSQQSGVPGDVPVAQQPRRMTFTAGDFDGDGRADVTVFRASSGSWFIRHSYTGFVTTQNIALGQSGDIAVAGDYDGDHKADAAVFSPSTGTWLIKQSIGGYTNTRTISWGLPGDVPVPADYDGDGRTDVAVFRPSTGDWYVRLSSSDFAQSFTSHWGGPGDIPLPADYDGDGRADLAVFRPSTGQWLLSLTTPTFGTTIVRQWGLGSDIPVAADFDGDGRAELTVYRPSTGQWLGIDAILGFFVVNRQFGLNGDVPLPHDFDGDGIADSAVFRPSSANWFIRRSSNGSFLSLQWGLPGSDAPALRVGGW